MKNDQNLIPIEKLNFGFNDAENYKRRENKELFNQIFVKSEELDKILEPGRFFLIGDKGTGKTAYAVYLSNNDYKETRSSIKFIRETEYQKFISLKADNHLQLSDYSNIWKVILFLLISRQITDEEPVGFLDKILTRKFKPINDAVQEYYLNAFSPEIIYALNFVEEAKVAAEIIHKHVKIGGEKSASNSFAESRFQINLMYIEKQFEKALSSVKLEKNHILFIDGIDIRPGSIEYEDYLECIKGLVNAIWTINSDFFANIKDSPGRMKVVLLIRPDIFSVIGLQNLNNKIKDNSILLDLRTTYPQYRSSLIFRIVDNLLRAQQAVPLDVGDAWDKYFPYKKHVAGKNEDSFISFLRYSMSRPRDIISALSILKENYESVNKVRLGVFTDDDFESSDFKNKYSEYMLGEIKDFLSFYYKKDSYEIFLKFFEFLEGRFQFTYFQYEEVFEKFISFSKSNNISLPSFFETRDKFLQFLYELNVICYLDRVEGELWMRWCYRERSYSNISPKVRTNSEYRIHYGLMKALNIGKIIKTAKRNLKKRGV
jgi:hypothetical protein